MAKKIFNEIMAGIEDAAAFAKCDRRRGVEHVVRIPGMSTCEPSVRGSA